LSRAFPVLFPDLPIHPTFQTVCPACCYQLSRCGPQGIVVHWRPEDFFIAVLPVREVVLLSYPCAQLCKVDFSIFVLHLVVRHLSPHLVCALEPIFYCPSAPFISLPAARGVAHTGSLTVFGVITWFFPFPRCFIVCRVHQFQSPFLLPTHRRGSSPRYSFFPPLKNNAAVCLLLVFLPHLRLAAGTPGGTCLPLF